MPEAGRLADPALDLAIASALAAPLRRVQALDLPDGRRFWMKRVEQLSGRLRLQKGDPARAFAAEREGLRAFAELGLPVAPVVREGPGWMVLADVGLTLPYLWAPPAHPEEERLRAFAAAGHALAAVHRAGLVHGRPAVRDLCWDGTVARFIDLERFRPGRRGRWWQALDVVVFAQTCFTQWPKDLRWLDAALASYATEAPAGATSAVARLARALTPLGWLASGLSALRQQSRELQAVALTLTRLRRL